MEKMLMDRRQQEKNNRVDRVTRYPAKMFDRDEQVWLQDRLTKNGILKVGFEEPGHMGKVS